ncbi:MAG: GNAT family N-acetyltransferase [Candidatus Bipolaricaulota bacterium]
MGVHKLDRALRPGGVAFASVGDGRLALQALRNLLCYEFAGEVFLVGGGRPPAERISAVDQVQDLPPNVDLAVLDAPPIQMEKLVQSCAEMGLPGVLVLPQDAPLAVLQALSREYPNTRFIGPGSRGLIVPSLRLNASLAPGMPAHGSLALVSSSPLLWEELLFRAEQMHLGLSHLVSLGAQVDVDLADLTDYLHRRGRVRALALDVDSIPSPTKLLPAVWSFARDRPLIAYRPDQDWDWAVFSCALRRAGAVPLRQSAELLNLVELLSRLDHPPPGGRIAVLASAECGEPLRECVRATAELSARTRAALRRCGCSVQDNCARLPTGVHPASLMFALEALLNDRGVDMLLVGMPHGVYAQASREAAAKVGKPLVAVTNDQGRTRAMRESGIPVYPCISAAARALGHLADYVHNLEELHRPWRLPPARPAPGEFPALPAGEVPKQVLVEALAHWGIIVGSAKAPSADRSFVLGLRRHPVFGTVVIAACSNKSEAHPAVGLPPLTESLAHSMLGALPQRLSGPAGNALAKLLLQLSRLAVDLPEVEELDLAPIAFAEWDAAPLGARARVNLSYRRPHLSLCPYPEERIHTLRLKDKSCVTLRPIRPNDEPRWRQMLTRSSPDTLRLRYHSVHHKPSRRMARRHCYIDYRRELVMVAEVQEEGTRCLAGEGELFLDPDLDLAEFAVFVADPWQGKGLGSILTDHMLTLATELGAGRVVCELTPDNVRMITLLQRRGFEVRIMMEDGVVFAEKKLR